MNDEVIHIDTAWKQGIKESSSMQEEKYVPQYKGTIYTSEEEKRQMRGGITSKLEFELKNKCTACHGTGVVDKSINLTRLISMYPAYHNEKINFIKAVRSEYSLGLKEAKDIVDSINSLFNQLDVIVVTEGTDENA